MIVEKRIIAGYGDLVVNAHIDVLSITQMKLTQEIGKDLSGFNFDTLGDSIKITLSYEECGEFIKVIETSDYFEFKSYVFDFKKEGSQPSKDVFIESVKDIRSYLVRFMAC